MQKPDIAKYRSGLSVFDGGTFLNYAATAPLSKPVIEKMKSAVEEMKQPLGEHLYEALNNLEFARRDFAEVINAQPKEVAFTQNTSTAISTIALSLDWQPGDRVLVADNEFPSNYYPWVNLKSRGVTCDVFHPEKNKSIVETLKKADLKNVKLISLSAVSYETGRLYELKDFADFCRANGIYSCLDAIQALGTSPFDVKQIGVDFVGSGSQKWLMGPIGCGIIYARSELLEKMNVPFVGWTSVKYPEYMELGPLEFFPEMARFEPGLPNYVSIVGMAHSLKELKAVGFETIFSRIRDNTAHLQKNLKALGFQLLTGEKDLSAGIVCFELPPGFTHRDAQSGYEENHVKVTTRANYVRVSPHFFNESKELDLFLEKTEKIFKLQTKVKSSFQTSSMAEPSFGVDRQKILLTGATGSLGQALSREFLKSGFAVHLLGQQGEALAAEVQKLKTELPGSQIEIDTVNLNSEESLENLITKLKTHGRQKYAGLVNCAGFVEAALFHTDSLSNLKETFNVNTWAPVRLMHAFLSDLKGPQAIGILNIVSSTGRCGNPLLAAYGASNGALWTLSESLSREWSDKNITITTFVAPAMHSPMQKRMGRMALRYFRMGGTFDFSITESVAADAVKSFLERKSFYLSSASRLKIFVNAVWPESINKKVKKMWRPID